MGMKFDDAFPSRFFKATDLDKPRLVTIIEVITETLNDGQSKPVAYFENEDKALVLNRTTYGTIVDIFSDDTDDWIGKKIVLCRDMTLFRGQRVPCVRVRSAESRNPAAPRGGASAPTPSPPPVEPSGEVDKWPGDEDEPPEPDWPVRRR